MRIDPQRREEYRAAYQMWQEQLQVLHRVFLEDEAVQKMMFVDVERRVEKVRLRWWMLLLVGLAAVLSERW